MPLAGWFRTLPPAVRIAIPGVVALVAIGAAGLALSTSHPPASRSVAIGPTRSRSPSPSPGPTETASAPASATSCSAPSGGFPGSQLAAAYPVALAWSPNGRLFWAERGGVVKVFQGGAVQTFATVSTSTSGERGLLGLAISGAYVFAFYSSTDGVTQDIVRWTDCGGVAKSQTIIASGLPAGGDCCHKGGRLAVSPDGAHLFMTIGDNQNAPAAQAAGDPRGKVTRFNLDGGDRTTWTSGLRNPFGIAFAPDGSLAVTNNGPSTDAGTPCGGCGDEFYLVGASPGMDYQWPYCWGYSHPFNGSGDCHGLPGPQYSTEGGPFARSPAFFVAPTGVTWSTGAYANHFLFCAYSTHHMYEYLGQGNVSDTGVGGCELDVKQGPDGALYTSEEGAIYRH
ncbi:MAG TPA: PQQ-dependent sugar dehydrogenase [Candidatus Dormibacteraeota bacterium]|jgi:glucose/arabinose dehydrogenase